MWPPVQPKIASNSDSVAPLSAARVAPSLRKPCAEPGTPASRQAPRNSLPKDSLVRGRPRAPTMKVRSPHGPAFRVVASTGKNRKRYGDRAAALLYLDNTDIVANVLPSIAHGIATAQTRIEQHVEPHPLSSADGPALLVLLHFGLGPDPVPGAFLATRVCDTVSRIAVHELSV